MKRSFPLIALALGMLLTLVLMRFGDAGLPLLTALLISEFGFLLTAIAAGISVRDLLKDGLHAVCILLLIGNALLAANFLRMGLAFWPGAGSG
ncbi:MAG: hypothetical protein ABFS22_10900 [Pseudomonadota bacterium]